MIAELGGKCKVVFQNEATKEFEPCYGTLQYRGTDTSYCNICGTHRQLNGTWEEQKAEREKNRS